MRYFFHLHECGKATWDEDGRELPDLQAAKAVAVEAAREVMCAEVAEGRLCLSCCIVICTEERQEVGRVPFRDAVEVVGLSSLG